MEIKLQIENAAAEAFRRAPEVMTQAIAQKLDRGALELQRAQKRLAPKAFSILANSIQIEETAPLERYVGPTVRYAKWVEDGGKPKRLPPPENLMAYVKQSAKISLAGAPGSEARQSVVDDLRRRAYGMAVHLLRHGSKASPFVKPAFDETRGRIETLLQEGVAAGVAAAGARS